MAPSAGWIVARAFARGVKKLSRTIARQRSQLEIEQTVHPRKLISDLVGFEKGSLPELLDRGLRRQCRICFVQILRFSQPVRGPEGQVTHLFLTTDNS
jgi:hypothetical protein